MKLFAQFLVGFVGTILFLNAITWLFGQAVAAVVAWFIVLGGLALMVIGMTVGGVKAPELSKEHEDSLRDYLRQVKT